MLCVWFIVSVSMLEVFSLILSLAYGVLAVLDCVDRADMEACEALGASVAPLWPSFLENYIMHGTGLYA